jgi:tetratricopeptide (TPR) repeat protein
VLREEILRVLAALALYLLLYLVAHSLALDASYSSMIQTISESLILSTEHYQVYARTPRAWSPVIVHTFAILFTLSLFLTSTRLSWRERSARFGTILLVLPALHLLGWTLVMKYEVTSQLMVDDKISVYSPWAFQSLAALTRLSNHIAYQAVPFGLLLLTVYWSREAASHPAASRRGQSRGRSGPDPERGKTAVLPVYLRIGAVAALMAIVTLLVYALFVERVRLLNPDHVEAHVALAKVMKSAGHTAEATRQLEDAIAEGSRDGDAWLLLALTVSGQGDPAQARQILQEGLQVVEDPVWRAQAESYLRSGELFGDPATR